MKQPLTHTMKAALSVIRRKPGVAVGEVPGGKNTIAALMRRARVEISSDHERVYLPEHDHVFKTTLHLDTCHSYTTSAACECGVALSSYGERSVKSDPYSAVWMDFGGVGDDAGCVRCQALMAGAPRRFEVVIQRPYNYAPPGVVAA